MPCVSHKSSSPPYNCSVHYPFITGRRKPFLYVVVLFLLAMAGLWPTISTRAQTQKTAPSPAQTEQKPAQPASPAPHGQTQTPNSFVMDGAAGPCSAEFNVTTPDGKPLFATLINVRMAYGFGGFHKLDMGVYTNHEGVGKFTGLPVKVKNPPLEFRASKDQLVGMATVDPFLDCHAKHDIVMDVPKTPSK
jgi:hypothetical protein